MELNLKQTEIEAALRQYVSNQGFDLAGRAVTINFTSGRTPAGLSALIDIGDVTEVPQKTSVGLCRSAELRASDVQPGLSTNTASVAGGVQGKDAPEAGAAGESLVTPEPEAEAAGGEAPVSLFAKPTQA